MNKQDLTLDGVATINDRRRHLCAIGHVTTVACLQNLNYFVCCVVWVWGSFSLSSFLSCAALLPFSCAVCAAVSFPSFSCFTHFCSLLPIPHPFLPYYSILEDRDREKGRTGQGLLGWACCTWAEHALPIVCMCVCRALLILTMLLLSIMVGKTWATGVTFAQTSPYPS